MKEFIDGFLAISTLALISLFSGNNLLVLFFSIIISFVLLFSRKSRVELLIFLSCGFLGAISEIIAISFGSWRYSNPSFFGIPIWLPVIWAIASVIIFRFANFIKSRI